MTENPQERDVRIAIEDQPAWVPSAYPPAEIWELLIHIASILAERPPRPEDPRIVIDLRNRQGEV